MSVLAAVLTLALLAGVIAIVSAPLLAERRPPDSGPIRLVELHSARDAKYREIRDLELDYRTGKLSREDYEATDGKLRSEALEILNRLEQAEREENAARAEREEIAAREEIEDPGGEAEDPGLAG